MERSRMLEPVLEAEGFVVKLVVLARRVGREVRRDVQQEPPLEVGKFVSRAQRRLLRRLRSTHLGLKNDQARARSLALALALS